MTAGAIPRAYTQLPMAPKVCQGIRAVHGQVALIDNGESQQSVADLMKVPRKALPGGELLTERLVWSPKLKVLVTRPVGFEKR